MVNDHNCYWGYDGLKYCRMCGHRRGCADHKAFRSVAARSARTRGSLTASRSERVRDDGLQLAPVLRPLIGAPSQGGDYRCAYCRKDGLTQIEYNEHLLKHISHP